MRYLAIDHGNKRTGLAICDASEMIASPLMVIDTGQSLIKKIIDVIKAEHIEGIVVGLPLNMDDSQGFQAKTVIKFAEQLQQQINIPLYFQDERLSSFGAEQKLSGTDYTRGQKKKRLDAIAAAEILESFLQSKKEQ